MIGVQGRLQSRSWVQQDGQKRYKTEVVADSVQALDKPKEGQAPAAASQPAEGDYAPPETPAGGPETDMDYDPFAEE